MSFLGCFLLTWEETGGDGWRAEGGGQRQLRHTLPAHPVIPQFGKVRGQKKVSRSFYVQSAAQTIQTARFIQPVAQLKTLQMLNLQLNWKLTHIRTKNT